MLGLMVFSGVGAGLCNQHGRLACFVRARRPPTWFRRLSMAKAKFPRIISTWSAEYFLPESGGTGRGTTLGHKCRDGLSAVLVPYAILNSPSAAHADYWHYWGARSAPKFAIPLAPQKPGVGVPRDCVCEQRPGKSLRRPFGLGRRPIARRRQSFPKSKPSAIRPLDARRDVHLVVILAFLCAVEWTIVYIPIALSLILATPCFLVSSGYRTRLDANTRLPPRRFHLTAHLQGAHPLRQPGLEDFNSRTKISLTASDCKEASPERRAPFSWFTPAVEMPNRGSAPGWLRPPASRPAPFFAVDGCLMSVRPKPRHQQRLDDVVRPQYAQQRVGHHQRRIYQW